MRAQFCLGASQLSFPTRFCLPIMASRGRGRSGLTGGSSTRPAGEVDPNVTDLLQNLHLTADEEELAAISDDGGGDERMVTEYALVGKVLSPAALHVSTIKGAMKPAWGNPPGLEIRSICEKGLNLFTAEFGHHQDMIRVLESSPWMVGRHAVILQAYDESLRPSEIGFDKMEMWVRILNLPLGWMNAHRGERAMSLIGNVIKMDVDKGGKASGAFLCARVAVEIGKPLRRGVHLQTDRSGRKDWFDLQYEKLPYYCKSCGIMGHSELDCENPVARNALGKLPYDIKLRAPDEKKFQSFSAAAAESYGSGSSGELSLLSPDVGERG